MSALYGSTGLHITGTQQGKEVGMTCGTPALTLSLQERIVFINQGFVTRNQSQQDPEHSPVLCLCESMSVCVCVCVHMCVLLLTY